MVVMVLAMMVVVMVLATMVVTMFAGNGGFAGHSRMDLLPRSSFYELNRMPHDTRREQSFEVLSNGFHTTG